MEIIYHSILQLLVILLLNAIKSSHQTVYSCNSNTSCGCSTNSATVNRIVGGEAASSATWGWAVSISIANRFLCGGSIISSSWVITAAHCVNGYEASNVTIYAGSLTSWSGTQTRVASQIIVHSNYNTTHFVNDIALIRLAIPLVMCDPGLSLICLPPANDVTLSVNEWPPVGTLVVAVGWGRVYEYGPLPHTLQQVTLQIIDYQNETCTTLIDWRLQICAGVYGGGKDTCQGDSGGPLMMFTSNKQWILIGVTSNGIGCARPTDAGTYTRVAVFTTWINSHINEYPPITSTPLVTNTSFPGISLHANIKTTSFSHIFVTVLLNLFIVCFY